MKIKTDRLFQKETKKKEEKDRKEVNWKRRRERARQKLSVVSCALSLGFLSFLSLSF